MATTPRSGSQPHGTQPASATPSARGAVERAEAVLVEQYPRLVRLAYLTLPTSLGRHTRVLLAHRAVQQALPRAGGGRDPGAPGGTLEELRVRVVRAALAPAGAARGLPARTGWLPAPPFVWGLRLWPPAGGIDEAAELLGAAPGPVRAAFVLHRLDGLADEDVTRLLGAAGAAGPEEAVREARAVAPGAPLPAALLNPGFDASVVSARPTDLLRRRRRVRAAWAAAVVAVLAAGVLVAGGSPPRGQAVPAAGAVAAGVLDPARLARVPAEAWADTARVDFTAWPARGGRTADRALLTRALGAWAARPGGVRTTAAPGTTTDPPAHPPHLLYAGDVPGDPGATAVVLLLDAEGDRVARYTESAGGPRGTRTLDVARTDEAGVTTAAALTLTRTADGTAARYLIAPWIASAGTRDLLRAADTARPLTVAADGVTAAVPVPSGSGGCGAWPVVELTSSARIVEKHSFVLTDLGTLAPVHLTYTPLPDGPGAVPARQPREATGAAARTAWAAGACGLRTLSGDGGGSGVRAVNVWDFADSDLPDGAGRAVWSCTRASGWAGPGDVLVQLRPPSGPPQEVARARSTAACGRFGQHLLAGTRWRSPAGRWYLLAAGSREVTAITASGAVRAETGGRSLVAPVGAAGAPVSLTARLASGARITALDGGTGGRD
ncbi:hypothetical protein OG280_40040 [Streptomyces virginiae]|uniref:hypothetical protein n=1 Tax=Streptomyces virginiae TaxID=1961 RepID=UPI003252B21E